MKYLIDLVYLLSINEVTIRAWDIERSHRDIPEKKLRRKARGTICP
jgi:hypothetical protein